MTVETVDGVNYIRPLDTSEFREIGGGAVSMFLMGAGLALVVGGVVIRRGARHVAT